jgi:hypothetical protein
VSDRDVGDRDRAQPADLPGGPLATTSPASWPQEGNVAVGVLCGTVLSMPLWAGVFGALRAFLG